MSSRSYKHAIDDLNSLQSNAAVLEAARASGPRTRQSAIPEMIEYLGRMGYTPHDLDRLNVVHITGTKGKGSTSAFTDSILRHVRPGMKTGLYTSPHLIAVRERIRINGVPLSEADFTRYFYEVWDKLHENTTRRLESTPLMPGYFRFLTLMAFHTLLRENVNVAVLEVGIGGAYDSTNIVPRPVVTGVTALGLDHVNVLGKTIQEIAWQKGGIYKEGVPAFSVEQHEGATEVLRQRATELKASKFSVVASNPAISNIKLGLPGAHQYQNASLALTLAQAFLHRDTDTATGFSESYIEGLENARWPGRCQTVPDPHLPIVWYLDGAHTSESIECCLQWFVNPDVGLFNRNESDGLRILLFNCTHGRSGTSLLKAVHGMVSKQLSIFGEENGSGDTFFDHVVFCTNITYADGHSKGDLTAVAERQGNLDVQQQLASSWLSLVPSFPSSHVHVLPTIEDAVQLVRSIDAQSQGPLKVLVTGSLLLVGGLIESAGLAEQAL